MSDIKKSTITKDQLFENGWVKVSDPVYPAKKVIVADAEIGELAMIVHRLYNTDMFALSLPDGAILNINPSSIEELNAFESLILSFDPVSFS